MELYKVFEFRWSEAIILEPYQVSHHNKMYSYNSLLYIHLLYGYFMDKSSCEQ